MIAIPYRGQKFAELKKQFNSTNLFTDPLFPNDNSSLCYSRAYFDSKFKHLNIVWKRPKEICSDAVFVNKGFGRLDINQGQLGDCWFIAGMVAMIQCPYAFNCVIPQNQSFNSTNKEDSYTGMFHFRFWRYGEWNDVVIDDFLPYSQELGGLVFCHNSKNPNEFWPSLLEKAYAKFNGCYQKLDGGILTDALVDMSAGIVEEFFIKDSDTKMIKIDLNDLWSSMYQANYKNSMIGCGVQSNEDGSYQEENRSDGLIKNHGYTITKLATIKLSHREIKLVRIKNPYGNDKEWNGPWSDNSNEWSLVSEKQKRELGLVKENDGEFWMSFDDFVRVWDYVNVCHLTPYAYSDELKKTNQYLTWDQLNDKPWKCNIIHSKWVAGKNSGGPGGEEGGEIDISFWKNPKLFIRVDAENNIPEKETGIIISLTQKKSFLQQDLKNEKYGVVYDNQIDLSAYWIDPYYDTKLESLNNPTIIQGYTKLIKENGLIGTRETTLKLNLKPGIYFAVPYLDKKNINIDFMLRIFSEKNITIHLFEDGLYTIPKTSSSFSNLQNRNQLTGCESCGIDDCNADNFKRSTPVYYSDYSHDIPNSCKYQTEKGRKNLKISKTKDNCNIS